MGYESSDSETCTCPICLEPLLHQNLPYSGSAVTDQVGFSFIGTTVPCGHCLHVHCWDQWTATSINRLQRNSSTLIPTKCPLCNVPTSSFVRLYLNLNQTRNAVLEDDDDDSLFNFGTDDDDRNQEKGADDSAIEEMTSAPVNEYKKNAPVDDNGGVDFRNSEKYRKCKDTLRKLQYENRMLQTQFHEKNDLCHQMQSKVQVNEEKLRTLQLKVEEMEQSQQSSQLLMDSISYEIVQLKRDFQNLKAEAKEFAVLLKQKDVHIKEMKQRYENRIKDMQKQQENMKEVQQILMERPKLVEEVRSLKEQLRRMQQQQLQEASLAHGTVCGRLAAPTRQDILTTKKQGVDIATHKQRKRMLLAVSEQIEESENASHLRKRRTVPKMNESNVSNMERSDRPTLPANHEPSHAKAAAFVTELLSVKNPTKASHVGRKTALLESVKLSSSVGMKPCVSLAQFKSTDSKKIAPGRSKESSAVQSSGPHRKQATLLHFSKNFDKP